MRGACPHVLQPLPREDGVRESPTRGAGAPASAGAHSAPAARVGDGDLGREGGPENTGRLGGW